MSPRELWIQALRSGEFKQAVGTLETKSSKFCCLGVACILAERAGIIVSRNDDGMLEGGSLHSQSAVLGWLNLKDSGQDTLVHANDAQGKSFEQIANIIEEQEELFNDT